MVLLLSQTKRLPSKCREVIRIFEASSSPRCRQVASNVSQTIMDMFSNRQIACVDARDVVAFDGDIVQTHPAQGNPGYPPECFTFSSAEAC